MRRSYLLLFFFLLSFSLYSTKGNKINYSYDQGDNSTKGKREINKPNTNDFNNFIAINQIFMWVGNNGMGSHDPRTDGSGFYWPGGENATISAIYEDGLIWGAKVDSQIRVNGSTYRHGLQAGKILPNGEADDPNLGKYRIYKIRKGWENLPFGPTRDAYEKDYNEWPIEDGAPFVLDGYGNKIPEFVGDEVLWCVMNDLDSNRSKYTYGTLPMGLEVQMTVYGFNRQGDLGDVVFKKYTLINKGSFTLKDMNLAYWSDPDLGNAGDDYVGCDTLLNLGYSYNGDNNDDDYYGPNPPAVGNVFLQGPTVSATENDSAKFLGSWRSGYKNLPMTAFYGYVKSTALPYVDAQLGTAIGAIQFYNNMMGRNRYGDSVINPLTNQVTPCMLAGDPVEGTGWYEGLSGWPGGPTQGDRRHLMSSGTFTMAPGDTQEVVVGIIVARGSNNLNSITELKKKAKILQLAYDRDFDLTPAPVKPVVTSAVDDKQVSLYWQPNAENYDEIDPLIMGKGKADTTYSFEGYRIWQYEDESGKNPKLIKIFDIQNDVTKVTQPFEINGVKVEITLFELSNQGITRFFSTNYDKFNYAPLVNGMPYYFGVTAFGYSKESDPKYLESIPQIIKVIPEKINYDSTFAYRFGSSLEAKQTVGIEDGNVRLFVVNPLALTGDTYKIVFDSTYVRNFANTADSSILAYSLLNVSKSPMDTLFKLITDFSSDSLKNKLVTDGFTVIVKNTGLDSINPNFSYFSNSLGAKVKSVTETANGNGNLATPVNVLDNLNSTHKWSVKAGGWNPSFIWQTKAYDVGLGTKDYEIRFSGTSEFYVSRMNFAAPFANDSKLGKNAPLDTSNPIYTYGSPLPFQIFQLGQNPNSTTDDKRLIIKILDKAANDSTRAIPDSLWSRTVSGNWEEIYAYEDPDIDATIPLPLTSGTSLAKDHKFGQFKLSGELPEPGTVIRLSTYKPLVAGNQFMVTAPKAILSGIDDKSNDVHSPNTYALHQNYPNPFNPNTTINYSLANPGLVTVKIFNILGEEILQLVNEYKNSGSYSVNFDASRLSSGIYFYTLNSGSFVSTKKMIVLK